MADVELPIYPGQEDRVFTGTQGTNPGARKEQIIGRLMRCPIDGIGIHQFLERDHMLKGCRSQRGQISRVQLL